MGALARPLRVAAAVLLCAAVLTPATGPLGRARAATPCGVTYSIQSTVEDRQTTDTVNGVTTHTEYLHITSHSTSNDGQTWDDDQVYQRNADGTRENHERFGGQIADGSNGFIDRGDTWDSAGNRFHQGTETWTDADGNRTTTTDWEQFDSQGRSLRKGEDVKKDKVAPPTPAAKSAPPKCSPSPTAASSQPAKTEPAPTDPEQWTGTITYRFAGSATGSRPEDGGYSYPGTYDDTATYTVVLGRDDQTSSGASWSVVSGTATASVNDDVLVINQGTSQRTTSKGQDWVSVPRGACSLAFSTDRRSYSIECGRIIFDNVQWTLYEPNEPGRIFDGPITGIWSPPQVSLQDIPLPSDQAALSGSRKVGVWVRTEGPDVQVQADLSWDLTAAGGPAPTIPPDVTGSVKLDGPPLEVSISQPGQRAVVGLPLQAGQEAKVKLAGNTIGPVKVSLVKPGGAKFSVGSSSESSFGLAAQTAKTSGTYSIVVEPSPGSTGNISVWVVSP